MFRRVPFAAVLAVVVAFSAVHSVRADVAADLPQKPNILFLVADDLGWNDVGYHNPEIRTPHIDRLMKEGVELDQHYVMPQCTPTRVALLTGRYPSRFGNHCTQASNDQAAPVGTPMLSSVLKKHGYETAIMGKWHLGSKPEWGPQHYGFDHSYGAFAGAVGVYDHRYRLNTPYAKTWHRNHEYLEEEGHRDDLIAREAVGWIEKKRDAPFFLYMPFFAVHTPIAEPEEWHEKNAHIERPDRRAYAAAITHLDHLIGELIAALDRGGQRENTLIVFTSDNGGLINYGGGAYPAPDPALRNFSSNEPLRGQKGQTYEGGMRVPAFVHWKGTLKPGKAAAPLHVVDWTPTLTKLVGAETKDVIDGDGRDIWPIVTGEETDPAPRTLYWVWGANRERVALRHGDWKIVRNGRDRDLELFHLATDPNEERDRAADEPETLGKLKALFAAEQAKDKL
ncbi:MAG: sulfatase-like hydrolase/transferase [Planctomycetaceae bacterium]